MYVYILTNVPWPQSLYYSIASVEAVAETGKICILDIDSEGVKSIKKTKLNPTYVFIEPPSIEALVRSGA